LWIIPLPIIISIFFFIRSGLYRAVLHQASDTFFIIIIRTITISVISTALIVHALSPTYIPLVVWIVYGTILLALVGGIRWLARYILNLNRLQSRNRVPVAIYGAGSSGYQLLIALEQSIELKPVAFVDDKKELNGIEIRGLKVYPYSRLEELIGKLEIRRILLSMPSIDRYQRQQIIRFLEPFPIHVQEVPSFADLANGTKKVDDIREIAEEDLLGRDPIPPKQDLLEECITGKSVLVTGAGGSIGSELCRQIIKLRPNSLILVERTEFTLHSITIELNQLKKKQGMDNLNIIPILGSVRHRNRMQAVLEDHRVQTIYHAAAYKHVSIVERNPIEGIQNNIFGTYQITKAAIAAKVETFVLISTDKAVRPTNVMGATKRCAELILQAFAASEQNVCFSMVRFGNVLNSSGSVIPIFRRQIRRGGPVTVTHPEVVRFFMTIPEATQLVIQAGAMSKCGDVFVLDMGKPVKILDLSHRMIKLSGLTVRDESNPNGDIPITITGLQPGEKLYEELLIGDNTSSTEHAMIMRVQENYLPLEKITGILNQLENASKNFDYFAIRSILMEAVEGYQPSDDINHGVGINKIKEVTA
jgi:UDP-N-acetylglucosamine 4,6-dehydratase